MFKDFSNEQTLLQRDLFREPEHFLGAMKAGREENSSVDFLDSWCPKSAGYFHGNLMYPPQSYPPQ